MDQSAAQNGQRGERTRTSVGVDVMIRGDIEGPTDLHVQGRVLGKVAVIGLVVDEKAEIEGAVTAESVEISGRVTGPVEARAVRLTSTARVEGDLIYASLQIEPGARLSGRCTFSDGGQNVVKFGEAAAEGDGKSDLAASSQELVRMAARLRRASE